MAFVKVASVSWGGANGGTSASIDTTGADLLVAVVVGYVGGPTPTLSDSRSNSWTTEAAGTYSNMDVAIYFVVGPTVGTGHDFTLSGAASYSSASVIAYSGADQSFTGSAEAASAGGSSSSLTAVSFTPDFDGALVLSVLWFQDAAVGTLGVTGGFTIEEFEQWASGVQEGHALAALIQASAAATNPTWSDTGGGTGALIYTLAFPPATTVTCDGGCVVGPIGCSGEGNADLPTREAEGACVVGPIGCSATSDVSPPEFSGSGTCAIGPVGCAAEAEVSPPEFVGEGVCVVGPISARGRDSGIAPYGAFGY